MGDCVSSSQKYVVNSNYKSNKENNPENLTSSYPLKCKQCDYELTRDILMNHILNTIQRHHYIVKCPYMKSNQNWCNFIWDLSVFETHGILTKKQINQFAESLSNNWIQQFIKTCPTCKFTPLYKEGLIQNKMICPKCKDDLSKKITFIEDNQQEKLQQLASPALINVQIHSCFKQLSLKSEDFFLNGDTDFSSGSPEIQARGGFPYYQPARGRRYGLNVNGKYDRGQNQWIGINGGVGEWAIAFHGVRDPSALYNNTTVLSNIMSGLHTGHMLIAGTGQAYCETFAVNNSATKIQKGVYLSPHIQVCLGYCEKFIQSDGVKYKVVLQCRVNPKKIKICSNQSYWVINDPKDIRPYGILLITEEDLKAYPVALQMFTWKKYEKQINDFLSSS